MKRLLNRIESLLESSAGDIGGVVSVIVGDLYDLVADRDTSEAAELLGIAWAAGSPPKDLASKAPIRNGLVRMWVQHRIRSMGIRWNPFKKAHGANEPLINDRALKPAASEDAIKQSMSQDEIDAAFARMDKLAASEKPSEDDIGPGEYARAYNYPGIFDDDIIELLHLHGRDYEIPDPRTSLSRVKKGVWSELGIDLI